MDFHTGNLAGSSDFFSKNKHIASQNTRNLKQNNHVAGWTTLPKWQGLPDSHFVDSGKRAAFDETSSHIAQKIYDDAETHLLVGDLNAAEQGFSHILNYYSHSSVAYKARLGLAKVDGRRSAKLEIKSRSESLNTQGSSIQQLSIISLGSGFEKTEKTQKPQKAKEKITELHLDKTRAQGTKDHFQLNIGDRIFFDRRSASLSDAAKKLLKSQADWLNKHKNYKLLIEAHADEDGPDHYNVVLSANRALNVQKFFMSKGIDPGRITTKHFGRSRPIAICKKESCSVQNRRAVTKLIPDSTN